MRTVSSSPSQLSRQRCQADELSSLRALRTDFEIGFGCVSCEPGAIDSVETIVARVRALVEEAGVDPSRVTLNPDCGFAPATMRAAGSGWQCNSRCAQTLLTWTDHCRTCETVPALNDEWWALSRRRPPKNCALTRRRCTQEPEYVPYPRAVVGQLLRRRVLLHSDADAALPAVREGARLPRRGERLPAGQDLPE